MRKYRGVPRAINSRPVVVPKEQPPLPAPQAKPASAPPEKRTASYRLQPLLDEKGGTVLVDIFEDEIWRGSRRTSAQCDLYMAPRSS